MLFARLKSVPQALKAIGATSGNSLLTRLVIWQVAGSAVMILGVCVTLYLGIMSQSSWVDDQELEKRFETVGSLLASEADREQWLAHEVSEDMEGPRRAFVRVILDDGTLVDETPQMDLLVPAMAFPQLSRGVDFRRAHVDLEGDKRYRVLVRRAPIVLEGANRQTVVQIAMDTTLDQIVLGRFERLVAIVAITALLAAAVLSFFQVSRLLAPLRRISDQIGRIDHTTMDQRVPLTGLNDELRKLGSQFNDLMARMGIAYQGLRHYADNVAHELRTPLNKMLLGLEVTLQRSRTAEQYEEAVAQTVENCREVNTLVDRLLFLARASNHQAVVVRQIVDIQLELQAVCRYFEASAVEAGVQLTVDAGDSVKLGADRILLQRAVTNLVANAIAHTAVGGEVRLSAKSEGDRVRIEVRDTGSGIGADDKLHIFDRFYRADKSRNGQSGRVGLGLPITKSIVELHGGQIWLDSTPGVGTVATIAIPLDGAAAHCVGG